MGTSNKKLVLRRNGTIINQCTLYDNKNDATPTTITGGSYLQLTNNMYLGLWPKSVTSGGNHSILIAKKNNINYWVETEVINVTDYTLTLLATSNQTITVNYTEPNQATKTISTSSFAMGVDKFECSVKEGTVWNATINAANGYVAGDIIISENGYNTGGVPQNNNGYNGIISSNITISATNARVRATDANARLYKVRVGSLTTDNTVLSAINVPEGITRVRIGLGSGNSPMTSNQTIITLDGGGNRDLGWPSNDMSDDILETFDLSTENIVYNNGYLNIRTPDYSSSLFYGQNINEDSYLYIGYATYYDCLLTVYETSNQTLIVKYTEPNAEHNGYENQVTITSDTSEKKSVYVREGTTYTAEIYPDDGYMNESGFIMGDYSGTITSDTSIWPYPPEEYWEVTYTTTTSTDGFTFTVGSYGKVRLSVVPIENDPAGSEWLNGTNGVGRRVTIFPEVGSIATINFEETYSISGSEWIPTRYNKSRKATVTYTSKNGGQQTYELYYQYSRNWNSTNSNRLYRQSIKIET